MLVPLVALAAGHFGGARLVPAVSGQEAKPSVVIARPSGLALYPRVSLAEGYEVDASWPRPSTLEEHVWGAMAGVAVAPDGRIWTFNRGPKPVQVFESDGSLARVWAPAAGNGQERVEFREPHQIRFDRAGNVWLVDSGSRVVKRRIEVANTQSGTTRVESGLQLEDKVVLSPPKNLREGDVVREAAR